MTSKLNCTGTLIIQTTQLTRSQVRQTSGKTKSMQDFSVIHLCEGISPNQPTTQNKSMQFLLGWYYYGLKKTCIG